MTNNGTTQKFSNHAKCNCKDCTKRFVGCHSTCEDYKAFKEENDKNKKAKKYNTVTNYSTGWGYMRSDKARRKI